MKNIFLSLLLTFLLFAITHSQERWDTYISSLQMPCYPPLARAARVQGKAKVKLTVGVDGSIASAEALEGNALLTKAAVENVRTWRFGTAERQSLEPTIVVFDYKLEDGSSGSNRCASRVVFESWSRVTVVSNFQPPLD